MPHFTLQLINEGPLVTAIAAASQARVAALTAAGQPVPNAVPMRALIDTGASCTCIDPSVLTSLQLAPTGTVTLNTPSTGSQPHVAYQYDISLVIPGPSAGHAPLVFQNLAVCCTELLVAQGFHALIGRDVLQHCVMTYNGSAGFFTLAY